MSSRSFYGIGLLVVSMVTPSVLAFSVAPRATSSWATSLSSYNRPLRLRQQLASTVSSNQDLVPGIDKINELNDCLFDRLENIREDPYFRLFSVDILASCEYMPQELFECYTESCEIYPADEDEVGYLEECLCCC